VGKKARGGKTKWELKIAGYFNKEKNLDQLETTGRRQEPRGTGSGWKKLLWGTGSWNLRRGIGDIFSTRIKGAKFSLGTQRRRFCRPLRQFLGMSMRELRG